jgi:ribosomal protection tetracycline resistance protein
LLDTPGHIDFSAQTERTLAVLDCAILVVSASDGVEGTTRFLWNMLADFHLPVFIFVNKTDIPGFDRARLMKQLQSLSSACVDFGDSSPANPAESCELSRSVMESIAVKDDQLLEHYLNQGPSAVTVGQIRSLVARRQCVPCFFGSALKVEGVQRFLAALQEFAPVRTVDSNFGARVIRISHDDRSHRLTWVRLTGGTLDAKQELTPGAEDPQKADELRIYDGSKYETVSRVCAGQVCTIVGPRHTMPGQGLGSAADNAHSSIMQPVLQYQAIPRGTNDHPASHEEVYQLLHALQVLDDEEPLLNVTWNAKTDEITLTVMGEIQLETISEELRERFHLSARFEDAGVVYTETVTKPIEGVGHFEPLRHYAEVHLLIEPAPRGSGVHYASACPPDTLESKWVRDILAFLHQKVHRGVMIGSPLTDVKITLLAGKANITHTVGGDFRQATWRAVRQGLMELRARNACQILEPWYRFQLILTPDRVGRAYSDIERMGGSVTSTDAANDASVTVNGFAPVSRMRGYARDVRNYTHGQGRLLCVFDSFRPCADQEQLIKQIGYDPMAHPDDTPDSVFCAHGAGYTVDWKDVPAHMHIPWQWENSDHS